MRFRIFTEPQEGATYDDQLAVALLAEELGFDAYFRSDHYIGFFHPPGLPGPTDAWVTLAGLARDTSRLRLGTLVSPVTFRNPGPLAIMVAQVDAMSGGRVELGLGAGWNDREHAAYGIPFPDTGERFDRLEEQLAIITGLWTTPIGGSFSFQLVEEFLRAFCVAGGMNLHVDILAGRDAHHMAEGVFKALARALDVATQIDPRVQGIPSTKGVL